DEMLVNGLALTARACPPIHYVPCVNPQSRHNRLHGTPMGEQGHDEDHSFCRGPQPIEDRAFGGAEGFVARVTDEAPLLPRMDTDIALASLPSGRAVPIGAECGCGVHAGPPGCAWKHCHEEYGWTPVCFTTSPYHDLRRSYQGFRRTRKLCRAQQISITRSRTPSFHRRIRSFTIRHRLTLLLTCSIRSRRWWSTWLARSCSRVSSAPRGFFVGMRISTSGSVNDRK